MKYGVIADSHDNFYNLDQAAKILKEEDVRLCFHLGDYCAPGFVRAMVALAEITWFGVWGNVDGAQAKIILEQRDNPSFDIVPESFRELELREGKIFLTHFPLLARLAAKAREYRACFYGDSHLKNVERLANGTLLANPGELAGFKTGQPSFGLWDSSTNEFRIVDLKNFR